ncbi:DsrE family protein [Aeromonas bivalvium]|uniref:DsrE family protein n=1 Tax=Aeromonas bivalvium TaxID=440079 RepID=UPI0038CFEC62
MIRVVFHLSERERSRMAFNNINNLLEDMSGEPGELVLLVNGNGVTSLLTAGESEPQWPDLLARGVRLLVCANSLRGQRLVPDQLLPGVEVVSTGVLALIELQQQGFAYIKS